MRIFPIYWLITLLILPGYFVVAHYGQGNETQPGVIAGSVFVEQVFAWPGLGRTMLSAIAARDYPVVLGLTVLYASAVIGANLLADIALTYADPRQRTALRSDNGS